MPRKRTTYIVHVHNQDPSYYGKSGGARVITYNLYQEGDTIIIDLLTIYDKGEISNISDEFISFLLDKRENG